MSAEVKHHPLYERFFIDTPRAGETYSYERGEKIIRWDHFMLNIPRAQQRARIEEVLFERENAELRNKSPEELRAMLDQLGK